MGHQSHLLHQMKALLAEGFSSVCSAVVLPIALNTTLLWDVSGVEGEKEQVQRWEQVQEGDLDHRMRSCWMMMKTLEQCGILQVKEVTESEQEAVQKQ